MTAKDLDTHIKVAFKNDLYRLSKNHIDRMIKVAERLDYNDEQNRERIAAQNQLENSAFTFRQAAEDSTTLSEAAKKKVKEKCEEILNWIDSTSSAEKKEIERKQKNLESTCKQILIPI